MAKLELNWPLTPRQPVMIVIFIFICLSIFFPGPIISMLVIQLCILFHTGGNDIELGLCTLITDVQTKNRKMFLSREERILMSAVGLNGNRHSIKNSSPWIVKT